jgi:hypothetical protein
VSEPRIKIYAPNELADTSGYRVIVKPEEPARELLDHLNAAKALKPSDRERLESLEKKLSKLLDEVASLKKHEEKAK